MSRLVHCLDEHVKFFEVGNKASLFIFYTLAVMLIEMIKQLLPQYHISLVAGLNSHQDQQMM
jgi:hypothetical protein